MVLCAYGDIFKAKLDDILSDIESFKTYVDDILVLGKGTPPQHIYQIIVIFARLHTEVIKFNAPKCSFGLK